MPPSTTSTKPAPPTPAQPAPTLAALATSADADHGRRWWVLAVMSLVQLLITVDVTIVNVALPHAQRDLGFADSSRQWVITAYALAFGSFLLVGGRIADLMGRRRTLLIGLALFGIGSALGGAAPDFGVLATARVLQGVGGALMAPAALGTITATFTAPAERARAFSVFGMVAGMGAAVGLLAGGLLTEHLNWRWTLYVNLLLAAVTLAASVVVVRPDTRTVTVPADAPDRRPRIDAPGTVLASLGLFGLVFGFNRAEVAGWSAAITVTTLILSALLLAAFIGWQTRASSPLLPLRIFNERNRVASLAALMLTNIGIFAAFLFLTYYLQQTLGYSPVQTGLAFLPLIGGTLIGSALALNVVSRFAGPRISVPVGMLLGAGSLVWMTSLDAHTHYPPVILPTLVLLGIGAGMTYPTAINLGTAGVEQADAGVAGALVNTTQQIGGSIGIALLSTVSASATTRYLTAHHSTTGQVLQHAVLHGYAVAYAIAAAIFLTGGLLAALTYRAGIPEELRSGQAPIPA